MAKTDNGEAVNNGAAALTLMEQALALLDEWGFALDVGAQLDLAMCRLRSYLGLAEVEAPESLGGPDVDDTSGDGSASLAVEL